MSDDQFHLLLGVIGTIGMTLAGTIRWSVTRLTKALDANTSSHGKMAEAQLEQAKQFAALTKSVEFAFNASQAVKEFIQEERSGVHDNGAYAEDPPKPKARTNPKGVPIGQWGPIRPKTEGER